jgi:predicted nucleotidyltransferase
MKTEEELIWESYKSTNKKLPSFSQIYSWFDYYNPFEDEGLYASDIKSIYLIGSRAKGTNRDDSDYDIAVEFSSDDIENTGMTTIQLSELLHQRFGHEMPKINNMPIDIQIFEFGGSEQQTYSKIPLID